MSRKSYIIGISGGSGSGKTSFMNSLKETFKPSQVCFISLDDYYLPREEQELDENKVKNFDLPSSIRVEDLVKDIKAILSDLSVTRDKYTFNNKNVDTYSYTLDPAPIIVIEGLFIYHYKELRPFFDLKVFIDAPEELKLIRRIKRDKEERNYPIEDVLYRYEHHVLPSYNKYILKYKREADLVINNEKSFTRGLNVLTSHLNQILAE